MAQATTTAQVPAAIAALPSRARWRRAIAVTHRYPVIPAAILVLLIVFAVFAPLLTRYDPVRSTDFKNSWRPPFWTAEDGNHVFGTDKLGRDVYTRVIYGGRVSLMVAAIALSTGIVVGTTLGLVAGYLGGHVDEIIMRLVDIWIALPFILVALVIAIVLGKSYGVMFLLLALVAWVTFVRPIRGEVLSLRTRDYVQFARMAGGSTPRILFRHILPGVINTVIVLATLRAGGLVLTESVLSFLGVGVPPPTPTWGGMVADGRSVLDQAWWVSTIPGAAIFLFVMSLNFLGDWFRDHFDPRLRQL